MVLLVRILKHDEKNEANSPTGHLLMFFLYYSYQRRHTLGIQTFQPTAIFMRVMRVQSTSQQQPRALLIKYTGSNL